MRVRRSGAGGVLNQACASCKHQRKKCSESCELAPDFPASRYAEFQNARRLHGVSNTQKIVASVEPHRRRDAAENPFSWKVLPGDLILCPRFSCHHIQSQILFYRRQLSPVSQRLAFFRRRPQNDDQ